MDSIGTVIRKHRLAKGWTQEELGRQVFVSKQAVSKWETGKTLPDIEMVRQLCGILDIDRDEILGGSMAETKKSRKWQKVCVLVAVISVIAVLFFGSDGVGYIDRHTQAGVAHVSLFAEDEVVAADEYRITGLEGEVMGCGYCFDAGYGELRGTLHWKDKDIEFGFINPNDWHNIHIRLDVEEDNGRLTVTQTVSFETDADRYQVFVTRGTTSGTGLSVFKDGL